MGVEDWQRVADMVTARRQALGETAQTIANLARISRSTLYQLEKARQTYYEPATLRAVEYALGWQGDSIEHILRGGQPRLLKDPDLASIEQSWPHLSPGHRRMLRLLATEAAKGTFS